MEEPKITSGTVPYIASEIPDDPRDITPEQWEAMKAVHTVSEWATLLSR